MINGLRKARIAKDITQTCLAKLTGLTQVHISNLERNICNPTRQTKQRIEKVLGHIDWIGKSKIKLRDATWQDAEITLKSLVEKTALMPLNERNEFSRLVRKYY